MSFKGRCIKLLEARVPSHENDAEFEDNIEIGHLQEKWTLVVSFSWISINCQLLEVIWIIHKIQSQNFEQG